MLLCFGSKLNFMSKGKRAIVIFVESCTPHLEIVIHECDARISSLLHFHRRNSISNWKQEYESDADRAMS